MEFLDPKKQRKHIIRLMIGYVLIGMAVILTTIILLYQAYGFGLKNGEVIQNGLIFVSTTPGSADIYVNGQKQSEKTSTRLLMPAGQYSFELRREGYRSWKRAINLEGGSVARFDYPLLFPTKLVTSTVKSYGMRPAIASQSPNARWLLVQANPAYTTFELLDLTKPEKAPEPLALPASISNLPGTHSWEFVDWANDNRHILLRHLASDQGKTTSEFILLDRESPSLSVNLSSLTGITATKIEFLDKKHDKYLIYTDQDHRLLTASLEKPKPEILLDHVLTYKAYGEDVILYATTVDALPGKTSIKLKEGETSYPIRQVTTGSTYLLGLARYENAWYVAVGASNESRTYVYKNPVEKLTAEPEAALVPVHILKAANPTDVSFSGNARFIAAQGQQVSVYDTETDKGYMYATSEARDAPGTPIEWIDGYRMSYVSMGKTFVFDFDNTNRTTLVAADSLYLPFFADGFKKLYTITPQTLKGADGKDIEQFTLTSTALRTPADQ